MADEARRDRLYYFVKKIGIINKLWEIKKMRNIKLDFFIYV